MEKDIHYFKELMRRYVNDECVPEEVEELMAFVRSQQSNRTLLDEIYRQYHYPEETREPAITTQQSDRLRKLLLETVTASEKTGKERGIRKYLLAAAAVFLIGMAGYWLYQYTSATSVDKTAVAGTEILPGTEKAIIHFSDGRDLRIDKGSDGILYKRDGLVVSKEPDGTVRFGVSGAALPEQLFATVTTPVGGESRVMLPDGSKLWLNAGSSVRFPVVFPQQGRQVHSSGEVYFEVAKDAARPFKVASGNQSVEVLGTHFVVNTGADASVIKTTLLEGSIKLSGAGMTRILKPGQESKFVKDRGNFTISHKNNPEASIAWKEGFFEFDTADFKTMEEQIRKWYDVEFVYDKVPDVLFYGKIERTATLSQILRRLEIVANIHFKTEGRKIYVAQ